MVLPSRQLYIISDLHLGGAYGAPGERGFRLCTNVPVLVRFIDSLTAKPAGKPPIELVINGDMVDFLAERNDGPTPWSPFTGDQDVAARKLTDILSRDQAFTDALRRFMDAGHRLVLLLGNHDLELVLPLVRKRLRELLGVQGQHDFEFIHDGEGYLAGDVLIEHGNRYDKFNVVNQDALRHFRSLLSRRQPVPPEYEFDPPPGSKMVSTVINPIKEKYRFVDLLKPETGAVIPMLLALEPGFIGELRHAAALSLKAHENRLAEPAMPSRGGNISALSGGMGGGAGMNIASAGAPAAAASDPLMAELQKHMGAGAHEFMAELGDTNGASGANISTVGTIRHVASLLELIASGLRPELQRRLPHLLKALRALKQDRSFAIDDETDEDTWKSVQALAKNGVRHVVFGHTHLPKRIKLDSGGYYLNSGTWADVLAFPKEVLEGTDAEAMPHVEQLVASLSKGDFSRWAIFHPTYVRIDLDGGAALAAELCDYTEGAAI